MAKKYFNISVDFEDMHRYSQTLGGNLPRSASENSVFENAIPRFIDLFDKYGIKATFFITGDEVNKKSINRTMVKRLHESGHEIANHTYHHYFNFSALPYKTKEAQILDCQKLLEDITGERVRGYRAPCYDVDDDTLRILAANGYAYDSSIYPFYFKTLQQIGYFFWNTSRGKAFGKWRRVGKFTHSFAPNKEHFISLKGAPRILEIPIPMAGILRMPFYSTMIFQFGTGYFDRTYSGMRKREMFTFELHSIDLIDYQEDRIADHYRNLITHPAMALPHKKKTDIFNRMFDSFNGDRSSVTLKEFAESKLDQAVKQ